MKTKILVCLLALSIQANSTLYAQTIQLFIVADTQDQSIGTAAKADLKRVSQLVDLIGRAIDYRVSKTIIKPENTLLFGARFNSPQITSALLNLRINKEDLVFFYYGGHGSASIEADNPFARVAIAKDRYEYLSLKMVQDLINLKNPKFSIVIGSMCNGRYADSGRPTIQQPARWEEIKPLSSYSIRNFRTLFLGQNGNITATSSQPGTLSYAQVSGENSGGIFTIHFQNALLSSLGRSGNPSWETIFKKATAASQKHIQRTPYYELNLDG